MNAGCEYGTGVIVCLAQRSSAGRDGHAVIIKWGKTIPASLASLVPRNGIIATYSSSPSSRGRACRGRGDLHVSSVRWNVQGNRSVALRRVSCLANKEPKFRENWVPRSSGSLGVKSGVSRPLHTAKLRLTVPPDLSRLMLHISGTLSRPRVHPKRVQALARPLEPHYYSMNSSAGVWR